mmetsp:Transcript_40489/g.122495  ORF Transcript_40489/g.122495 Transcript_40489/m.122495 type:complete len:468 (-) Transcript_40489:13-1416(-)
MPTASDDIASFLSTLPRCEMATAAYWRDLVAFTDSFATIDDPVQLQARLILLTEREFSLVGSPWGCCESADKDGSTVTEGHFRFTGAKLSGVGDFEGRGYVRLRDGKLSGLFTMALKLVEPPRVEPPEGCATVLIVGAGQGGLALAAQLGERGVSALVVERNARVGDNWRSRYEGLHLHDPREACALPGMPMPADWPTFVGKDRVGDYLEEYSRRRGIRTLLGTEVIGGAATRYDSAARAWRVGVRSGGSDAELCARHLVLATGLSGFASMPDWPRDGFEGSLVHSSGFKGSSAARAAGVQRAVVVGSNTSAHDVAQSLHEAGVHVTLVQRSPTTVISIASHAKLLMGAFLEDGMGEAARTDAEIAGFHSKSYRRLARDSAAEVVPKCKEADAALHRGLSEAGFALDWGEDESGLLLKFLRRGGGYYMSIGASELIAAGKVDVVAAVGVEKLAREGGVPWALDTDTS